MLFLSRPAQRFRALAAILTLGLAAVTSVNVAADPRMSERAGVSDYPGFMALVREIRPAQCTLVPDGDAQLTSDHGFDLRVDADRLLPVLERLRQVDALARRHTDPIASIWQMPVVALPLWDQGGGQAFRWDEPHRDAVGLLQDVLGVLGRDAMAREEAAQPRPKLVQRAFQGAFRCWASQSQGRPTFQCGIGGKSVPTRGDRHRPPLRGLRRRGVATI